MPQGRGALIVATDIYQDPELSRLRAPGQDAKELAAVLQHPGIGGFDVQTCLNEHHYEIRPKLEEFFLNCGPDDVRLLHFSCHGIKDAAGRLFFAATDTKRSLLQSTAISADWVNGLVDGTRSRRVVLLLDCCYSGAFAKGAKGDRDAHVIEQLQGDGRGRVVLTASNALEYAWEGDQVSGAGQPSVFTAAVVEGLRTGQADADKDGWVSADDLYNYVFEAVRRQTPQQHPNRFSSLEGQLFVARSVLGARTLPDDVARAIKSQEMAARLWAIGELERLADGASPGLADTVRSELQTLVDDDSRTVSRAAEAALAEVAPRPATSPQSPDLPGKAQAPVAEAVQAPVVPQQSTTPLDGNGREPSADLKEAQPTASSTLSEAGAESPAPEPEAAPPGGNQAARRPAKRPKTPSEPGPVARRGTERGWISPTMYWTVAVAVIVVAIAALYVASGPGWFMAPPAPTAAPRPTATPAPPTATSTPRPSPTATPVPARWQVVLGGRDRPGVLGGPWGLAIDSQQNLYVAENMAGRVQKLSPLGQRLGQWSASAPTGLAVDKSGNVYVASGSGVLKTTPDGQSTEWPVSSMGIAVDGGGNVWVTDPQTHRIRKLSPAGAQLDAWGSQGDGPGEFNEPYGIAVDRTGHVYIADRLNHRIQKLTPDGVATAVWGKKGLGQGQFNGPVAVAVDGDGNVFVADHDNRRIQQLSSDGQPLRQWSNGRFVFPRGVTVDDQGNLFVADFSEHNIQVLRREDQ